MRGWTRAGSVHPNAPHRSPPHARAHEAAAHAGGFDAAELKDFHGLIILAGQRARAAGGWELYGPTIGISVVMTA